MVSNGPPLLARDQWFEFPLPPPKSHANPIIAKDLDGRASGKSPAISQQAATEEQGPRFALPGNAAGSRAVGGDCRICLKKSHQLFRFPDLRLDKLLRKHLARPSRMERKGVKKRCLSP